MPKTQNGVNGVQNLTKKGWTRSKSSLAKVVIDHNFLNMEKEERRRMENKNKKVFLLKEEYKHNYRAAEQWGEIISIFTHEIPTSRTDKARGRREEMLRELQRTFAIEFSESLDSILLSGDPLAIFLAGRFSSKAQSLNLLKYDRHIQGYVAIDFNFNFRGGNKNENFN